MGLELIVCNRCSGTGTLTPRLGKPGQDPHTIYYGIWCQYPTVTCTPCKGTGQRKDHHTKQQPSKRIVERPKWEIR